MDEQVIIKRQSTFPLFSKYFNTHPLDAIQYSQNMKREMQDFIQAFHRRIEVEVTYSKNLQQVSKSLDKYIKPGTELSTSFICSAFKVEHEQRSRQALQLAQSLKTEIQVLCSETLKSQTATIKKMQKEIKKFYKDAQMYENNHRQALQNYEGINKQMQEMIIAKNIMRHTTGIPQEKKVKMIGKAMEGIKNSKQYEKIYLHSVKTFNAFIANYNKQITVQMDQIEHLVREQIILQSDCLRKLIVAEVSMFKNIQYDLLNISKQMEHLDTQKEVQIFVEDHKNNSSNAIIPSEKIEREEELKRNASTDSDVSHFVLEKKVMGKSMLSESIMYVEQQYFAWMISNKKHKRLRQIVGKVWRMLKDQFTKNTTETGRQPQEIIAQPAEQKNEKLEEGTEKIQTLIKKQIESKENDKYQSIQQEWDKQLKDIISTFKILQPPNFIPNHDKKQKGPNQEKIYSSFMEITSTIALLWNCEEIDPEVLTSKLSALELCLSQHHLYRLIAFMFIEEYRLQHEVIIKSTINAKTCGRIIRSVLVESQKAEDVFIIRGVLGLVFTYYWIEQKSKRLLYQIPEIYQCEVWKRNDFWEAAIYETTYEEMSLFIIQKGETQSETILRQKNIIFSQLASFCHYMVMMGIASKNVRLIVGRYCRLYQMSEEQNRDLSKMITNTYKQYKQTFQVSTKGSQKQKSVIGE